MGWSVVFILKHASDLYRKIYQRTGGSIFFKLKQELINLFYI